MQGNWVVEILWWMPRTGGAGNIAWGDQGLPKAVEPTMMIIIPFSVLENGQSPATQSYEMILLSSTT